MNKRTTTKKKKLTIEEENEIINSMQGHKDAKEATVQGMKIKFKPKTENQKKFVDLIKSKELVIGAGFAGTGKTFLACAAALMLLQENPEKYHKIILVKSVIELIGENLGALPGSIEEKTSVHLMPFKDNLYELIGKAATESLFSQEIIKFEPLAFVRGRTFKNAIVIIDESQNISTDNLKTILTRISGEHSKVILIGDEKQTDLKNKKSSGLSRFFSKIESRQEKDKRVACMRFEKGDQVRNPLIKMIEDVFDEIESEETKK